jgi:hypothetical protein
MLAARFPKRHALLCVLIFTVCALASLPFAEIGGNDDFSYIRSAKTLADTGHIAYFGWSSAMLGWQLYLGALFIKIFGSPFTATRLSVLLVGAITTCLLQRVFVHLGLSNLNASFATLTIVLSPLFLPLSVSFMSDIPGLLAIVACLYLCLLAIETASPERATLLLCLAAVVSAILGTARQTGWLGVIVIVPSALWIVRPPRRLTIAVLAVWITSIVFIFAAMRWFSHQMYATVEEVSHFGNNPLNTVIACFRIPFDVSLFLLPVLIAFLFPFFHRNRRLIIASVILFSLFAAYLFVRIHSYSVSLLLAPASSGPGDYVTSRGMLELPSVGERPTVLDDPFRALLTIISTFAGFAFLAVLFSSLRQNPRRSESAPGILPWKQLLILLAPFTAAYCVLLSGRILAGGMFDRYLLPLFLFVTVVALRFYQERITPKLPPIAFVALILSAAYAIAGTHDLFSTDRARLAAIEQLRNAGLPRTAFYGGFDYDGWTQIDNQGYIEVDDIRTPTGIHHVPRRNHLFHPCGYYAARLFPTIHPLYAISYDNQTCDPQDRFSPVTYRMWLPPFSGAIYTRAVDPDRLVIPGE